MNKDTVKWIFRYFFVIAAVVFILIYLRWFQLTPFVVPNYGGINGEYIAGLILLVILVFFATISRLVINRKFWHIFLSVTTAIPFALNLVFVYMYMPRVEDSARYNGITYYVTRNYLAFEDRSNSQLTKWTGFLNYERIYLGRPQFRKKIIYDETTNKVIIIVPDDLLVYIDGEPPERYDIYIEIDDHLYYPAYRWIPDPAYPYLSKGYRWWVYQCKLDNSSCKPLPFEYEGDYAFETSIEKNDATNEISVYFDIGEHPGVRTLIFTWGEHPRCHAKGCEILEK
ncbi:MAG: hypothetical protein WCC12_03270 [Anaerolineales bacterium]